LLVKELLPECGVAGAYSLVFNFLACSFLIKITTMHKLKLIILILTSLSIVPMLAGCAGGKTYESTGEHLDDSIITSKVKASILGDSKLKVMQIGVETFKGVVQLSGFVNSTAAATRAVDLARRVKGVKQVNNSLIVK
jgi:BON domain